MLFFFPSKNDKLTNFPGLKARKRYTSRKNYAVASGAGIALVASNKALTNSCT